MTAALLIRAASSLVRVLASDLILDLRSFSFFASSPNDADGRAAPPGLTRTERCSTASGATEPSHRVSVTASVSEPREISTGSFSQGGGGADGLSAFTASAATGGGNTFAIADYGTSTNPLSGGMRSIDRVLDELDHVRVGRIAYMTHAG